jgi:hypothetical protein
MLLSQGLPYLSTVPRIDSLLVLESTLNCCYWIPHTLVSGIPLLLIMLSTIDSLLVNSLFTSRSYSNHWFTTDKPEPISGLLPTRDLRL